METITQEISQLQGKLRELEQQKYRLSETKEKKKTKNDAIYGLVGLKKVLDHKIYEVKSDRYSKACVVAKFQDRDIIPALESIYDALHMVNTRIDALENKKN